MAKMSGKSKGKIRAPKPKVKAKAKKKVAKPMLKKVSVRKITRAAPKKVVKQALRPSVVPAAKMQPKAVVAVTPKKPVIAVPIAATSVPVARAPVAHSAPVPLFEFVGRLNFASGDLISGSSLRRAPGIGGRALSR